MTHRLHIPLILVLLAPFGATPATRLLADDTPASAWDLLRRQDPEAAKEVGAAERLLLQRLSITQARAFVDGVDPQAIELDDGTMLAEALKGIPGGFDLSWWTFDSGGGTATGGGFTLTGTLGQPDAGLMGGGGYSLAGGYLPLMPGIFVDGLESGDTSAWSQTTRGV